MIEKFPKTNSSSVILVRAESSTGHILDEDLKLATNAEQKVYTVFEHLENGVSAAKKIITANPQIECAIYDPVETLICILDENNIGDK